MQCSTLLEKKIYLKNVCSSTSYFRKPFYNTQMKTVNIRIVPINSVHMGGLVLMREIKHDTGKETERDWQKSIGQVDRLWETKKDAHSNKKSEGAGAEIMTERHQLQDIKTDGRLSKHRTDRQREGRHWQRDKDTARQGDKQMGERRTAGQIGSKRNGKWERGTAESETERKDKRGRQEHAHVTPLI